MPVLRTTARAFPHRAATPLIEVKREWSDEWALAPELKLQGMTRTAGEGQVDSADFFRSYGQVKLPWEADLGYKSPWTSAAGWWVRISLASAGTITTQWIGRIEGEARDPHGELSHGPAGTQHWRAYGPQRLLEKLFVSRSYCDALADNLGLTPEAVEVGWIPDLNGGGTGNRTELPTDDAVYVYGFVNGERWTHLEYAEYLLHYFLNADGDDAPTWTLSGQLDILERLEETIRFKTTQTVGEIFRELAPRRLGVDWLVEPTEDGFAIRFFALSPIAYEFGSAWMPANPDELRMITGDARDVLECRLVWSEENAYKTIRVLGNRVVCCGTLVGDAVTEGEAGTRPVGTMMSGWTDEQEEEYQTYVAASIVWDDVRIADDVLRDVYQRLRISFDALETLRFLDWSPTLDTEGNLEQTDDYQPNYYKTLDWLPLRTGIDYSADPEEAIPEGEGEYLPPQAYLRRYASGQQIAGGLVTAPTHDVFIGAAEAGYHIEALPDTIGLRIHGGANWELADNHYAVPPDDRILPLYDWEASVLTVAWETDERFGLEYTTDDATVADGVLEVLAPDANLWVLPRQTVVGVSAEGALKLSGDTDRILRQDNDRLLFTLAGVLSRYYGARCLAEITVRDLLPWSGLLGQILRSVESDGALNEMAAPVTTITWSLDPNGNSSTTLSAGYAK